jgi:hypothetical protein
MTDDITIHTVITVNGVVVADKKRFASSKDLRAAGYKTTKLHVEVLRDLAWHLSGKDKDTYCERGAALGVIG